VPLTDDEAIETQVRQLIGAPGDFEDFLDRTRDATRQMRFVTGARLLSGILSPAQAGQAYSAIARAVIRASFDEVRRAFEADHGKVPGARVAILGLGRLGSRELTAGSDLDLVVLYDFDEERRESTGPRSLDAVVYHTRLTQRLVAALTAPTRRGRLYDVDLRLRPQGGKGPVASQFKGFLAYQQGEAELWEHMALTRARVLVADDGFGPQVEQALHGIVGATRDARHVFKDVRAMRELIAQEKGDSDPWDLKLARGGLTDLDFLAQALTLAYASRIKAHPGMSTGEVLVRAREAGLLPAGDAERLADAYRLFGDLFQWQRLMIEGSFDADAVPRAILKRLASVAGLPSVKAMMERLEEVRGEVRGIFETITR
jgi:glutamate-ammonia-ligase adenylyltransferase